ncbi:hypothetical protein COW99_03575 [Candidatus Roizmanbacteria bacterium CG22_combo_CG10-13_8_21_14_all_38_20]|uniref:Probable 2-phosphosulfolactate phosphatase n=1 Tax=Candidatus Roizmanbacteria bacterium CG22_combo_CG10-13_8_21_14_all_38_20 TaxID=1974862 RepID=A0A2H0BX74_9BACT|nr:2-phosphosulfolactate phosphatase [Candidatus Microgenomates bacterium]PIP61578.1 MAG: hypothetical protein COW99_03575 [Candidatus Roizmanbacteria bacterium CG22_combo_CG10-13_8_21_14_all_38_20]PJC31532.1 MAG: hypothetical protein CO050_03040 [Candidatus Roizmanbacteria bacterium CG_4_9_14_0_2_um_filter_38_17]
MNFKLVNSYENAGEAEGLVVVIDVLRAFTTSCFIINNNARQLIAVDDSETALKLKKKYPEYILIGERKGIKPEGFDHGNSPHEIKDIDFTGKTVVLTTTTGTKGVNRSVNADEVITGSFVNAKAISSYILKTKPRTVSFVCTDDSYFDNEDFLCASYIKSLIEKKSLNFTEIKSYIQKHPCSYGYITKPLTKYARQDFAFSLTVDTFDFILMAKNPKSENIILEKVSIN